MHNNVFNQVFEKKQLQMYVHFQGPILNSVLPCVPSWSSDQQKNINDDYVMNIQAKFNIKWFCGVVSEKKKL